MTKDESLTSGKLVQNKRQNLVQLKDKKDKNLVQTSAKFC